MLSLFRRLRFRHQILILMLAIVVLAQTGTALLIRRALVSQIGETEADWIIRSQVIPLAQWYATLLVILIALAFVFSRRIDRPLTMLVRRARALAAGRPATPVARAESGREFIELVDTFNEMADQIRQRTEALENASLVAAHANRAKSEFLANMSHELRTPLNGVLGYVQILQRDGSLTETQRESLRSIEDCGQHLLTLINDVLDLSKIEAGRIEVVHDACDLERLLDAVCSVVRQRAEQKGLRLRLDAAPALPAAVLTDQTKIRQILVNLLSNAVKFTDHGEVTLAVSESPPGRLAFAVTDTGVGIAPDQHEAVFDPFKQVAGGAAQGGTGLGLAISKRLVEALGGRLELESTLGQGSTFRFSTPLQEVRLAAAAGASDPARTYDAVKLADGQDITVLVADDRAANRDILVRLLQHAGFRTLQAENGQEALDQLRTHRPPLVFMDIRMPVMDGLEATRRIREDDDLRKTVVIAVSASVFQETQDRIAEAGCDAFLAKPIRAEQVFGCIAEHLGVTFAEHPAAVPQPPTGEQTPTVPARLASEVASRIRKAAEIGNVTALNRLAADLADDPGCGPDCGQRIRQLAKAFDFDGLAELADCIEQTNCDETE